MLRFLVRPTFAVLLSLPACGPSGSGSAAPPPDYPHSRNFVLTEGQTYVKNPDVALKREYWIIARSTDGTSFMLPRPDGDPRIVQECRSNGPLASIFANAKLCEPASAGTLDRVNRLTTSEAMQTSTFLHSKLKFTVDLSSGSARVEPFPHTDDLLDICKTFADDRNGVLKGMCDEELKYENATERPAVARIYSEAECAAMAKRLNEVYGIP